MTAISADPRWRGLFATAGAGALFTVLCIPLQIALFIAFPPPTSYAVEAWFSLFLDSPVLGLLSLDLLMMIEQVLLVPIVLAAWLLAHRASESAALLGAAAWLLGAVLILGSNTGFEMLALARGWGVAGPTEGTSYVAAAQAMLASYWDMGTGFVFGYVLASIGGILIGATIVRARVLGRWAGWLLIVANVAGLGIFLPTVGIGISLVSVLILWAWYLRTGWTLMRMARTPRPVRAITPAAPLPTSAAG